MGQAISAGDVTGVSSCWIVPALVLSDQGSVAVTGSDQIEAFFGQAAEGYRSRGLVSTRPELERVETLSETPSAADVRWPAFHASGQEKSSGRSH